MNRLSKNHETNNTIRGNIIALHKEGLTKSGIAMRLGLHRNTVSNWINRFKKEGSLKSYNRAGAPHCTTEIEDQIILQYAMENPLITAKAIIHNFQLKCSSTTVRNRLLKAGVRQKVPVIKLEQTIQQLLKGHDLWRMSLPQKSTEGDTILVARNNEVKQEFNKKWATLREIQDMKSEFKPDVNFENVKVKLCNNSSTNEVKSEGEIEIYEEPQESDSQEGQSSSLEVDVGIKWTEEDVQKFQEDSQLWKLYSVNPKKLKQFICLICGNVFKSRPSLNGHVKYVHRKLKPYKCHECDYKCGVKFSLSRHIQAVHEKSKQFKCLECENTYKSQQCLSKHVMIDHKLLKPFKCANCDSNFKTKVTLANHILKVHDT